MTLYGIPNCDTVRKARQFLADHHIEYQFHDFKKDGLNLATIQQWLSQQPIEVLVNKRSTSWKTLTEAQKLAILSQTDLSVLTELPTLIKRPILELNSQLIVGFSADQYQILL